MHKDGSLPTHWPSGDPFCFFPAKYGNFPDVLESMVIRKLTPEAKKDLVTTRTTLKGKTVPHVRPWGWAPGSYTPFEFTPLGKRIVGLEAWDEDVEAGIVCKKRRVGRET